MPQKGQITKHEWKAEKGAEYWLRVCPVCHTRRILQDKGIFIYKIYGDIMNMSFEEPKCITRKIQADENKC